MCVCACVCVCVVFYADRRVTLRRFVIVVNRICCFRGLQRSLVSVINYGLDVVAICKTNVSQSPGVYCLGGLQESDVLAVRKGLFSCNRT